MHPADGNAVVQGQTVTFTGTGFTPGESVTGTVHSQPVNLGTVAADAQGNVSFTWNVPAGFAPGEHTVTLKGETSKRAVQATFTVVAAPAPPQDGLASTGTSTAGLWGGSLILVLLGAGVVLGNRRRAGLHK